MKMFDGFAEDSWKLKPTFLLTVGVRYDIQLTPAPGANQQQLSLRSQPSTARPSRTLPTAFSPVSALAGRLTPAL